MRKSDRWIAAAVAELATTDPGVKVLVAVDGFFEPGRECVADELLMPQPTCGRPNCTCEDGFHGVSSHGTASVAQVRRLLGVPPALARMAIAAAMQQHDEFEDPERCAAAFLDEVAQIEEGRLVRREVDILLPFPRAARIVAPHQVEYHLDDEL